MLCVFGLTTVFDKGTFVNSECFNELLSCKYTMHKFFRYKDMKNVEKHSTRVASEGAYLFSFLPTTSCGVSLDRDNKNIRMFHQIKLLDPFYNIMK